MKELKEGSIEVKEIALDEKKIRQKLSQVGEQDFYKVRDSRGNIVYEPSAKALQVWANEAGISTQILEYIIQDNFVLVKMAGWIGEKSNPKIYKEALMRIDFKLKGYQWLFTQADQGKVKIKIEDGKPIPADYNSEMKFLRYYFNLIDFAPRVAVTKCEAILFKKLLSLEFRESEEIEFEKQEIQQVEQEKESERSQNGIQVTTQNIPTMKQIEYIKRIFAINPKVVQDVMEKYKIERLEDFTREMVNEVISNFKKSADQEKNSSESSLSGD